MTGDLGINSVVLNQEICNDNLVIDSERALSLSERDAILLIEALDKQPKANAKLQAAFINYRRG